MTDCIRRGKFAETEAHRCFVLGCTADCYPLASDTCPKCNFKFCDNGHCGCHLTEEARYAVNVLYETYCEYCKEVA